MRIPVPIGIIHHGGIIHTDIHGKQKDVRSEDSQPGIPVLERVFPLGDAFKVKRVQTERDPITP